MGFPDEYKQDVPGSMIERVARALAASLGENEEAWRFYVGHARAAITVMREPTERMLTMGQDDEVSERSMRRRWQAMIDAALKEVRAFLIPLNGDNPC